MNETRPVPNTRGLPAERARAAREQLEQIVATQGRPGRRRRPGLIAGAGAVVVLCTSAAAVVYVQGTQPVTDKAQARCYTVASLAGGDSFHGTTIGEAARPGSAAAVDDALSVCAALFRQGFLQPGAAGVSPPGPGVGKPGHRVPPLITCVMPDGTAAVFPGGTGTCQRLGLPRALGTMR